MSVMRCEDDVITYPASRRCDLQQYLINNYNLRQQCMQGALR